MIRNGLQVVFHLTFRVTSGYKAANWIHVGQTQGRGKLDRDHKADLPTKSIWLYPLSKHFRRSLRST